MPITSPNNLWSPDPTDPYNLTLHLAQMQTSVQAALNTKQNTLEDTGWVTLTLQPGVNPQDNPVLIRRKAGIVYLMGGLSSSGFSAGTDKLVATLPVGFRPIARPVMSQMQNWTNAELLAGINITTQGNIFVKPLSGVPMPAYWFFGSLCWPSD